jgi:hypothetical protein
LHTNSKSEPSSKVGSLAFILRCEHEVIANG